MRSRTASLAIGDEFAHISSDQGWASDERVLEALEGSMSVFDAIGKSKLILISTPAGEIGAFWRLFCAARDGELPNAAAVHEPAWRLNEMLDTPEWHESKIRLLGIDGYRQEHGAEFTIGSHQFFNVPEMNFVLDEPAHPDESTGWVIGLDPGFHHDRFGVAVVGESRHREGVFLVGALWAVSPKARAVIRVSAASAKIGCSILCGS